jgi:hypothetical protein
MFYDIERYETWALEMLDAHGAAFAMSHLEGFVPEVREQVLQRLLARLAKARKDS